MKKKKSITNPCVNTLLLFLFSAYDLLSQLLNICHGILIILISISLGIKASMITDSNKRTGKGLDEDEYSTPLTVMDSILMIILIGNLIFINFFSKKNSKRVSLGAILLVNLCSAISLILGILAKG